MRADESAMPAINRGLRVVALIHDALAISVINSQVSLLHDLRDRHRWDNRDAAKRRKELEEESDTMDALCLDFLNSEFRDFRGRWAKDHLLEADWLEQFLIRWKLQPTELADPPPLADLLKLRALLRHMIEALASSHPTDSDLAELNTFLLAAPSSPQLVREDTRYYLEQVPQRKDWKWVQARIAASFAELLVTYEPRRLKVCENAHCRWIFYDESKSHTRRFCTSNKCANLVKMRRFRTRHKASLQGAKAEKNRTALS